MARILNTGQQLKVRALTPRPAYSRVVGFTLNAKAGAGWVYANTPPLGNNIWLLRVTLRNVPRVCNAANYTLYQVLKGTRRPLVLADIAAWDYVIPNIAEGQNYITPVLHDGEIEHTEQLERFYRERTIRFGLLASRVGDGDDYLQITFQISEG